MQGRGTVVTGRIESGIVKVGDEVEVIGITAPQKTIVTGALGRTEGRVWRCVQLLPVSPRLPVRVYAMQRACAQPYSALPSVSGEACAEPARERVKPATRTGSESAMWWRYQNMGRYRGPRSWCLGSGTAAWLCAPDGFEAGAGRAQAWRCSRSS